MKHHVAFEYLPGEHVHWPTVSMVNASGDIPVHLSIRPEASAIIVNAKDKSGWGREKVIVYDFDRDERYVLRLAIGEKELSLYVNGEEAYSGPFDREIDAVPKLECTLPQVALRAVAGADVGGGYLVQSGDREDEHVRGARPTAAGRRRAATGRAEAVQALDQTYYAQSLQRGDAKLVRETLAEALITRVLPSSPSLALDCSGTKGLATCLLRTVCPSAEVLVLVSDAEEERIVAENLARNGAAANVLTLDRLREALALRRQARADAAAESRPRSRRRRAAPSDDAEAGADAGAEGDAPRAGGRPVALAILRDTASWSEDALADVLAAIIEDGAMVLGEESFEQASAPIFSPVRGHRGDVHLKIRGAPWTLRRDRLGKAAARDPVLEIAVAMYNSERFIVECVESLLAEPRDDILVTVVDDGSTDGSAPLVEAAFGSHPRVRLLQKPNGGCASARNYARITSTAEHLAFVDADDFVDPKLFPTLLDAARVAGYEIVQGGFVLYDDAKKVCTKSYEADLFASAERLALGDAATCFVVGRDQIIGGQPTIWRRVYRRDFLDARDIFFPEHIRAFDDMYFHICSVYHAREVLTVDDLAYYYRQHPGQDIKQGDERHFYELEMHRLIFRRAVREGWNDLHLLARAMRSTFSWSLAHLREDLVGPYLDGAAKIWCMFAAAFGDDVFEGQGPETIPHPDFAEAVRAERRKLERLPLGSAAAYYDSWSMQPDYIAMARQLGGA